MVREAIEQLRDHYLSEGMVSSYKDINNGLCVEFSEHIESLVSGVEQVTNDSFVMSEDGWNGDGTDEWDMDKLKEVNSSPSIGIDLLNQIVDYHSWIQYEGRHYDAECPAGVQNLFDLPFFSRTIVNIIQNNKKTQGF